MQIHVTEQERHCKYHPLMHMYAVFSDTTVLPPQPQRATLEGVLRILSFMQQRHLFVS